MSVASTIECPHCGHRSELSVTVQDAMPDTGLEAPDKTGICVLNALTWREREVLYALSLGATNKELARILNISKETVTRHLNKIYEKTGMGNRLEAVLFMQQHEVLAAGCKAAAK